MKVKKTAKRLKRYRKSILLAKFFLYCNSYFLELIKKYYINVLEVYFGIKKCERKKPKSTIG